MPFLKCYINRGSAYRTFLLLAGLLLFTRASLGQELDCMVNINATQISTSDRTVFNEMKKSIEQFMNGRKWTNDTYKPYEKIKCNLLITVTKMPSIGSFNASVQIQSGRPVYQSNYSSLVLNFADRDWEFGYVESQPLEFNDNTFTNNLTSMLAFYAYIILGFDYDTFSELGGMPYFQKAQQVMNNAQSSNSAGWQQTGSNRNRYWLIENIINPQMEDLHKVLYSYHRLGLDTFGDDPDKSRQLILQDLKKVQKVRDINPTAIFVITFMDSKSQELANIFSDGNLQVRREAYDVVTTIDPTNSSTYAKMIEN